MLMPMIVLMAGMLCFAGLVFAAFTGPSANRAQDRRLDALKVRYSDSATMVAQMQMKRILATRDTRLDTTMARFLPKPAMLRKRLDMTGKGWTVGQYGVACLALTASTMLLLRLKGTPLLIALFVGLFVGLGFPHKFIGMTINRRINKFNAKFPDAIELLVRGLRSGLPISETLAVVGHEVPGPVGVEFRSVGDKIKIGRTMDAALQETADRLGTPEFQFFTITLAIQRETGGNLAETLSNLANVLRMRAQMKLKIKAMSSESKASALIIGSLPFIVFGLIWFINGSYMQTFFQDQRLMVAGMGGMIWMAIGAFIMAKMISFEI